MDACCYVFLDVWFICTKGKSSQKGNATLYLIPAGLTCSAGKMINIPEAILITI